MKSTITSNQIISQLKAIDPNKAKLILEKVKNENTGAGSCQWKCAGHSLPKHNKLY